MMFRWHGIQDRHHNHHKSLKRFEFVFYEISGMKWRNICRRRNREHITPIKIVSSLPSRKLEFHVWIFHRRKSRGMGKKKCGCRRNFSWLYLSQTKLPCLSAAPNLRIYSFQFRVRSVLIAPASFPPPAIFCLILAFKSDVHTNKHPEHRTVEKNRPQMLNNLKSNPK